jgi:predicted porin
MQYAAPAAILGHGVNSPNFRIPSVGGNAAATPSTLQNMTSDSEKLTYFTPRIAGFQLGVSYTPDNCEENGGGIAACGGTYSGAEPDNNIGQFSEVFELGANYVQKWGDFNVAISGGYGTSDVEASPVGVNLDDRRQFSLGFNVGFGGFTVGGAWLDDDDRSGAAAGIDATDWNLGLRYVTGPWGVGITYAQKEFDLAGGGEDELQVLEVGGSYALGPGVDLTAGVQWCELDGGSPVPATATAASNDALVFIIGTALSF